jgi:hypothetical protein
MAVKPNPDGWRNSQVAAAIGEALLDAPHELTAKELEGPTGRLGDQSNLKAKARQLAKDDLVTVVPNPPRRQRLGRPAGEAFVLSNEQRQIAQEAIRSSGANSAQPRSEQGPRPIDLPGGAAILRGPGVGSLARGQELVIADVRGARLADLMDALSTGDDHGAVWSALCGDEYLFVFEGDDPAGAAARLLSALDGAGVPVRQAPVRRVTAMPVLADEARDAARERRKARMKGGG